MKAPLVFLIILLAILQYQFWLGEGGLIDVWNIQEKITAQKHKNQEFRERNLSLHAEVLDLKQGFEAIEERSRHDLGLIRPGETFFQVVDNVK